MATLPAAEQFASIEGRFRIALPTAAMSYLHNGDYQLFIHDLVHDPVNTLSDSVTFLTGELFASRASRVVGE